MVATTSQAARERPPPAVHLLVTEPPDGFWHSVKCRVLGPPRAALAGRPAPACWRDVADSTGELTAVFLGRAHIAGLEPGNRIRLAGRIGGGPDGRPTTTPASYWPSPRPVMTGRISPRLVWIPPGAHHVTRHATGLCCRGPHSPWTLNVRPVGR